MVLVDECSTLGNRDFARLVRALEATGAAARLTGDPRQHTAVAAGGAWRSLLDAFPDDVPAVTKMWRQRGEEMADVREALERMRDDDVTGAIDILRRHGRITEHASRDELFDANARLWYDDHLRHLGDRDFAASSVMTPHHRDRRELNTRIRELLQADGTLTGPALLAGDLEFQRGDLVIALEQDRGLRPASGGRSRRDFVHTAEEGVVVDVRLPTAGHAGSVVVDFERRGHVDVPMEYLTRRLDRGVHGALAHRYAVTSHAAQGATYGAARGAGTESMDPKAFYVAATRGAHDLSVSLVASSLERAEDAEHPRMPRLETDTDILAAFTRNMAAGREELLAREVDPAAARAAALRASCSLPELDRIAASGAPDAALAAQARRQVEQAIATEARLGPAPELVARLGMRPPPGPARAPWDEAVGRVAGRPRGGRRRRPPRRRRRGRGPPGRRARRPARSPPAPARPGAGAKRGRAGRRRLG